MYGLSNSSHKYPTKELTELALMLQNKVVKTKHINSLAWPDPISYRGVIAGILYQYVRN